MCLRSTFVVMVHGLTVLAVMTGCQASDSAKKAVHASQSVPLSDRVRRVVSLFDQKPWLNLDVAGDRDPEGIHYRVFLDSGSNQGELRDGEFRVELYLINRTAEDKVERRLFSDYVLPTASIPQVKSQVLGLGYHLHLRWAEKEIAGHEIEVITAFKDAAGGITRSATKRLHVPRYVS